MSRSDIDVYTLNKLQQSTCPEENVIVEEIKNEVDEVTILPNHSMTRSALPREQSEQFNRQAEKDPDRSDEQTLQDNLSLPNMVKAAEDQTPSTALHTIPSSFDKCDPNGSEESTDWDDDSIEDFVLTLKDLSNENGGSNIGKDSGEIPLFSKCTHNIFLAIAEYEGNEKENEIDLFEGQTVAVLVKSDSGWWFVESNRRRGWAPSNYLVEFQQDPPSDEGEIITHEDINEGKSLFSISCKGLSADHEVPSRQSAQSIVESNTYIAIANFNGVKEDGEVHLVKNQIVHVFQNTTEHNWWMIESDGEVGWAPSNYLEEISNKNVEPDNKSAECFRLLV